MANELRHSDVGTALSKSEWEAVGGHIFNSQAAGDIMYASTTSQLTRLGIGSANQILAVNSGATAPEWVSGVNLATNFTVSANNSTNETVYPVFVDGATGTQGAETDTGLTYNPSSGVLTATSFTGAVTGNVTGNASGTAATVTTAAQSAITSLGTLTTLTVDNVIINGTTIGHTSDTDLMTLTDGVLTVAGEIDGTTLDISGNADIDGTLEADAYTVDGTALNEYIADTIGAMVGGNTETRIAVTYDDADNTLDFVVDDMTASGSTTFVLEDDDGTEVTVSNSKEVKFIGSGVTTNWTDVDNGTDADPYDLTFTVDAAQTGITSVLNASLVVGRDADNDIDFSTDNNIRFRAGAEDQLTLTDGYLTPSSNGIVDLGTDALEFNNAWFDGTVTSDAFAGPLTGDVTGNVSGTAATVTGAAQSNITSLGTLTTLTVDNVIINGTTIGHTGDTDLLTLASTKLTVAGTLKITGGSPGADKVLTSDADGDASWEDAGGGGTLQLSNQGTIPAGAPVAIDSNGRATVISGLGSELALGSSHTTVADTVTNTSAKNYSYHYNSYATVLVDCGASGVVRLTPDEGTSKIRGNVGTYSTSHANGYTSLGTREMSWGVETQMADASADIWGYYLNAVWDVDTSEVVIMWIDASDSNKMKISFWSITDGRLVTAGSTGTVANYACNAGKLVGLDYDKNANKYICAWSKNSGHGLYTSVWENSGGNPAEEISEDQVGSATTTSALELKWANGGSGQDDIGLIVWEEAGDSSYIMACSMTHNDDDTIYHSSIVEPFGANMRVDLGDNTANRSISYDTSTTAVSGNFDSGDDLFLIAGAITDTDHMPVVVPIAAGGGGGTSPTISATGTVEKPFTAKPADWGGHSSGHVSVDDHVLDTLDGKNVSICYDPDRDCHVLIFRLSHYYMTDIDGGLYVNGQVVVSQTMNIHTDNTITNTYNTAYHLINGNRQNPSVEFANRSTNHNPFTYGFGRYGIEMMYHTTYNTMFIAGQDTILMDIDTEYEYGAHIMFAFNGNTTANGGSGALTYATSNIDRVAGLNTTAISDTGTAGTATITLPGAVNENVSGLTTGTKYYMGDSGTLTTNRPVRSRRWLNMGVATNATTKILVKADAEGQQH